MSSLSSSSKTFQAKIVAAFDKEENKNFEEFIERSLKALREEALRFEAKRENDSCELNNVQQQEWDEKMSELESLFKMFCVLKGQKKKKSRAIERISIHVYDKSLLARSFDAWKRHQQYETYLLKKQEQAEVTYNRNLLNTIFRGWQNTVISENKLLIKNSTLRKTELELQKQQRDYENQIAALEALLQHKILTLKHEEQQLALLTQKRALLMPNQQLSGQFE